MASTPLASPSRRYHPTSSPFFDSPNDSSNCSVIFGAGGSPSPSKANILTPISRRETLILPQGFAGRGKSLVVDSPSAATNNSESHRLLNSSSPRPRRSSSPTKGRFLSPLIPQQATPRSTRSSASSSKSSPDKENPTPRRSSRRKAASSTSTLDDPSTASPSRSLRFSSTPRSARRAQAGVAAPEEPSAPTHAAQHPQSPMLSEGVMLAGEATEERREEESPAVNEDMLQYDELQEETFEPLEPAYRFNDPLADSPPTKIYSLPPANLHVRNALSYDSDELTDTDAEGSYEIFSDDEMDPNAGPDDDDDVQDVLSQLQELRVESAAPSPAAFVEEEQEEELAEQEGDEEKEGSESELEVDELDPSYDLEAAEMGIEADEIEAEVQAQIENTVAEEKLIATPAATVVEPIAFEVEEIAAAAFEIVEKEGDSVEDVDRKQIEKDHQRVLEEQLRPPSPFVSAAPLSSPPPVSPVRTSPVLPVIDSAAANPPVIPCKPAPTPLLTAITPVRPRSATPSRAATASATPSATVAKRHPVLAAPTARRQLTKLTSKPAIRPTTSAADADRVLSGIVPSSAASSQRRIGITKSALPVPSSPPPSTTLSRTTGIPKSTAPLPSTSSLPSTSALPTPSIARSKIVGSLKSSAAPSKMAPPSSTMSRTLAPSRMMAPTARRTAPVVDGRPGSAASNSSGSSATTTLPRPRPTATKSLKPSASSSSSAPSLARPTSGAARRGLAAPTLSSSARTGVAPSPRPPSSTSALASRAPVPSSSAPKALPAPTALLPRPPSAPPSALPSSRLLPALAPTHSAPSVLLSEARPTPSPAPSPLPVQPTLPLLPRPAPLNPTPRSPDKRSAQRVVREAPADRLTKSDSENLAPRHAVAQSSQSTAPKLHRTALGATVSLPAISTLPPNSPIKRGRIVSAAPSLFVATKVEQASLLTAAPEKVDAEAVSGLFGAPAPQELLPAPARSTRARRTKPTTELGEPEPAPAPAEPLPLLPRPTRRPRAVVVEDVAESPSPEVAPPVIVRPPVVFNPAPALTQEELNRLTQKNTKRNQLHFNKHDVQTIIMDVNRPPSPTSKIRRSISKEGAPGRPTTKEGREARAANRRRALRSSTDGSELELMKSELGVGEQGEEQKGPVVHYRAPGDEEEFFSPVRTSKVLKGKKKESTSAELVLKTVKWDKALVYEGPLDGKNATAEGIIKRVPLDAFGNSTNTATGFAKPAPVQIKKLVYRDDE